MVCVRKWSEVTKEWEGWVASEQSLHYQPGVFLNLSEWHLLRRLGPYWLMCVVAFPVKPPSNPAILPD